MSLLRQLWLAVIASTLIAFAGSFVVSLLTARHYLEEQLAIKNSDNAATLALSMNQLAKDPVTVELQVSAVFDSGQYELIRITKPDGEVMIERTDQFDADDVPAWFRKLFPIESRPGKAQISKGWTQFGNIELVSDNGFAYRELWRGCLRLLGWFVICGIVVGGIGSLLLSRVRKPLAAMVGQAQAIAERRFVTMPTPRIRELKSVVHAMNAMGERLQSIFSEESARLDAARREANHDGLTGLANRAFFMAHLSSQLSAEDAPPNGTLILLRVADLAEINRRQGRKTADDVLRRVAAAIEALASAQPNGMGARLNGADFALLLPDVEDSKAVVDMLLDAIRGLTAAGWLPEGRQAHIAAGLYRHGESTGPLLARLDTALATAEASDGLAAAFATDEAHCLATSVADWKHLLDEAIKHQRLKLTSFPVCTQEGKLIHEECPLRLRTSDDGEWLTAGSFMPMASRLGIAPELDLAAVRLALADIGERRMPKAVNLSGESLVAEGFLYRLEVLLATYDAFCPQLWLEVSEAGVFQHFDAFLRFCEIARARGCQIGIEHFGRHFSSIGQLHETGIHYLKVDGSFVREIDHQSGNQSFLRGLCSIAHGIGLKVIAEGVQNASEQSVLWELEFDAVTGPGVR